MHLRDDSIRVSTRVSDNNFKVTNTAARCEDFKMSFLMNNISYRFQSWTFSNNLVRNRRRVFNVDSEGGFLNVFSGKKYCNSVRTGELRMVRHGISLVAIVVGNS